MRNRGKSKQTWLERLSNTCPCFLVREKQMQLAQQCSKAGQCLNHALFSQMIKAVAPPTQKKFLEALLFTGLYTRAECLVTLQTVYKISNPRACDIWSQFLKELNDRGLEAFRREDGTRFLRIQ